MKVNLTTALAFLLFITPFVSSAQGWERKFGSGIDYKGFHALPTPDSGYIMLASSPYVYGVWRDMWIYKTNANGDTLWTRNFTDVSTSPGSNIQITKDSGYIIAAYNKAGYYYLHLTKLSADGTIEWRKQVGAMWENPIPVRPHTIQQTADGGFIIAGELPSGGGGTSSAVIIKTDSEGELTWMREWQPAYLVINYATAVEQTPDGGYMVAGSSSYGGFIIKTDTSGYDEWIRTYYNEHSFEDMKPATDGNGYILVAGMPPFGNSDFQAHIVKIDMDGDIVFQKPLGEYYIVEVRSIAKTNDGGYCIVGNERVNSFPYFNVLFIKTDSVGDTVWTRTYGAPDDDLGNSVRQDAQGNFIIAGTATNDSALTQAYLIKTDSLGEIVPPDTNNYIITGVEKLRKNISATVIKILPNPLVTRATVLVQSSQAAPADKLMLHIYNAYGHRLKTIIFTGFRTELEKGALAPGIYFLEVRKGSKHIAKGKMLVQR